MRLPAYKNDVLASVAMVSVRSSRVIWKY